MVQDVHPRHYRLIRQEFRHDDDGEHGQSIAVLEHPNEKRLRVSGELPSQRVNAGMEV